MAYILVYSIIIAVVILILATLAAVIARRLYMEVKYRRLDKERERYSRLLAILESGKGIAYLGPYRKRPGSVAWTAIEEELFKAFDSRRGRTEAIRLFEKLGYAEYNMKAVRSGNRWEQAMAAERLGHMRCREALPVLIEALESSNTDLKLMAVHALGLIGDASALPHLMKMLRSTISAGEEVSRKVLTSSIISFGAVATRDLIRELSSPDWRIRAASLEMLGEIGGAMIAPAVMNMLKDPERDVRAKAAKCLGKLRCADALPALCEALIDRHWVVRLHCSRALGLIRDERAVPHLTRRLADRNWQVRQAVSEALGRVGGAAYLEILKAFVDSTDQYARDQALFELGKRGVAGALLSMLAARDGLVLREILPSEDRGGIRMEVLIDMLVYLSLMDEAALARLLTDLLGIEHAEIAPAEVLKAARKLKGLGMGPWDSTITD